jgi:ubiquinone/menaquinone biosynthesis C-methylase UbiE
VGWWIEHILPRAVDRVLGTPEISARRRIVCAGLEGTVLEIGFGSGLNVAFYPDEVERVLAVEPSDLAWRLSAERRAATAVAVSRAGLEGPHLDLADASVDTALSTFTLCTVPDLEGALAEIRRVLKPGGRLHFLEHGQAPDPSVHAWQRRLHPLHSRLAGGCHLDRPIADRVAASGLELTELDTRYGDGPRIASYLYRGRATKPA